MGEAPGPLKKRGLSRAAVLGFGIVVSAVVLFLIFWIGLSNTDMAPFPRVLISVCIPPAVIAALIGIYMLIRPGSSGL